MFQYLGPEVYLKKNQTNKQKKNKPDNESDADAKQPDTSSTDVAEKTEDESDMQLCRRHVNIIACR